MIGEEVKQMTLYQKLHAVLNDIPMMQKDKSNQQQGYKYLSEAAVKELIKGLFAKHRLMFHYSVKEMRVEEGGTTKSGNQIKIVYANGDYSIIDIDTPEGIALTGTWFGAGMDTGDKGLYKAITGGIKYVLNTTFLIPTGDDPENEDKDIAQAKYPDKQQPARSQPPAVKRETKVVSMTGASSLDKIAPPRAVNGNAEEGKSGPTTTPASGMALIPYEPKVEDALSEQQHTIIDKMARSHSVPDDKREKILAHLGAGDMTKAIASDWISWLRWRTSAVQAIEVMATKNMGISVLSARRIGNAIHNWPDTEIKKIVNDGWGSLDEEAMAVINSAIQGG